MSAIRRVGVIGAGTMGAGIAAQVANAGVPVVLLDIVPADAANRNAIAEAAVARLQRSEPAAFMSPRAAGLIATGNVEDHLPLLAECDWIVEAVLERADVKQALYRKIDAVRRADCIVSSNTSTIPLRTLTEGMPDGFARHFLITHFFNPPRYMRLLEIVAGPLTDAAQVALIETFADRALGKTPITCKDTPGFIANRLGTYWLQLAAVEAMAGGLDVETADAVMGRPVGVPNTGVFGLLDLVGIDLMPHINASMAAALPPGDAFHAANLDLPLVRRMIADGYTGRKGKGGFYRMVRSGGARTKEAIDLSTGEYRPARTAPPPEIAAAGKDLRALLDTPGPIGAYAWRVLGQTLRYAAALIPEAADDVVAIDAAMRLGYNWQWGPFELIDRLGAAWLADRLRRDGVDVPPLLALAGERPFYRVQDGRQQYLGADGAYHDVTRPQGTLLLADIKLRGEPVLRNASAALWDIGDGAACFEFTGKNNTLDDKTMELLAACIPLVAERFKALVIYNEGGNFSVGANLALLLAGIAADAWDTIAATLAAGQTVLRALKYAPFPVVSAPAGMALGGGCEILLHSDAVQAHAETYAGLVECGVGLLPGWGGCTQMLARWRTLGKLPNGPMPATAKVFEIVSTATTSKSAEEAKGLLFLRPSDGITMNRDRLLADAKARALALAEGYTPPKPQDLTLPGPSGRLALRLAAEDMARRGLATAYDLVVADTLAEVLCGGAADLLDTVDEARLAGLERAGFLHLARQPLTQARIKATLETGKPLRN